MVIYYNLYRLQIGTYGVSRSSLDILKGADIEQNAVFLVAALTLFVTQLILIYPCMYIYISLDSLSEWTLGFW